MCIRPVIIGLGVAALCVAPAWAETCDSLVPPAGAAASPGRKVEALDLLRLRDIGSSLIGAATDQPFTLSPDGSRLAFQLRQANPQANTYCQGMFVVTPDGPAHLTRIDLGGEFIKKTYSTNGFAEAPPSGAPLIVVSKWAPDGQSVAYLRRDDGVTQLWVARADGKGSQAVTHLETDVEDFAWTTDAGLVIKHRPALVAAWAAIEREGETGLLYDDRWVPAASNRPIPRDTIGSQIDRVDPASGEIRNATVDEARRLQPFDEAGRPQGANVFVAGAGGLRAWTRPLDRADVHSMSGLIVEGRQARSEVCQLSACNRIVAMWWRPDRRLIFLRSDGQATGRMSLFEWRSGDKAPKPVLDTPDYLTGCQPRLASLICHYQSALKPGRLVSVELASGRIQTIFNPNPEFDALESGLARRLYWTNALGIRTYGELVMPPGRKPDERVPLIVVQYETRGFLRGGTGDEFPIQALVAHGFAVLSVQRPMMAGIARGAKTWEDSNRISIAGWADKRSVQSTLETGVKAVVDLGIADPKRVGLTGLSDGASSAQFSLINSRVFSVAALATCCDEESAPGFLAGQASGRWLQEMGYPRLTDDGSAFWSADSLRANARRIDTPILMQVPDTEYLAALEGYTALKQQGKPVELYVFPDETHIKWQPAHRLAAYDRYIDWFEFWLNGKEDDDPAKAQQYMRWRALRDAQPANPEKSTGY